MRGHRGWPRDRHLQVGFLSSSSPADPSDPLVGETLADRYLIEARLGHGMMGAVYRARHLKVGRRFAVKVLHAHLLADPLVARRFEREAALAGRLRHANVIGIVDVGKTGRGLPYMVMDYAEGEDLAGLLAEAPMPPARIANLTRQLLEGLFHAHEAGLIHRDLKPENVIVERDAHGHEVPRIVDFGIAILKEGGESTNATGRVTVNGIVLGTPQYMAPEQAVDDPIDHRVDLFALGVCVYEMLCGKLPFDGTGAEISRAYLLRDPPPIAQRVPDLAVEPLLEAFARRLMARHPETRPPTARAARELLDLIEHDRAAAARSLGAIDTGTAQAPEPVRPAPPSIVAATPAPPRRGLHPIVAILAILIVLVLAAIVVIARGGAR
ncbi:MAG: serine/threonine-protein kinase [Proteobacteria bacterium]|nr:serine/threonine-protein kinase [Pseudomonadota bacterium]